MAVALARTGTIAEGARGLSLFLVPLRMGVYTSPLHNGVHMHRLKQKVGTYGVPTAELELRGTRAWLLGAPGEGVRCIVRMLNITHTSNTYVGDEFVRGVSGGERKRVSIAEMMATRAHVLCFDNSTRGLDASTALDFIKAMRVMTDVLGQTTFATL